MTRARGSNLGAGSAIVVLTGIIFPLYREFHEPGHGLWNGTLGLLLLGLVVAVAFLWRFFTTHAGEIGEARFDTSNKSGIDG